MASRSPQPVHEGYYTIASGHGQGGAAREAKCEPGHYCVGGVRRLCPAGRSVDSQPYHASTRAQLKAAAAWVTLSASSSSPCSVARFGSTYGLSSDSCSGECSAGYYCPPGSSSSEELECGDPSLYCPAGSGRPTPVPSGFYSLAEDDVHASTMAVRIELALWGSYASHGLLRRCPAGTYGDQAVG